MNLEDASLFRSNAPVSTPAKTSTLLSGVALVVLLLLPPQSLAQVPPDHRILVVEIEGKVEVARGGTGPWQSAATNQVLLAGDRFRTADSSRAVLRWSDLTLVRIAENTLLQIPDDKKRRPIANLLRGALYLFHRDKPGLFPVGTPTMSAVIRGTEFYLETGADGSSTLVLFDGSVEVTNDFGGVQLQSGQAAQASPGQRPARTAVLDAVRVVQWALYYPAILDLDELTLTAAENQALAGSLAAYRSGDLLAALAQYPAGRNPASPGETIYLAALSLAVGKVLEAERLLNSIPAAASDRTARLSQALRSMIATVTAREAAAARGAGPQLATEWLVESYRLQAEPNLEAALDAARHSVQASPNFAFGWARVAELEFGFGRTERSLEALDRSFRLASRNAEAWALRGFLLAAQNRFTAARGAFDQAIAIDGALGNAWLGRGLVQLRQGRADAGLEDLQTAAVLEPQRALLRSYLGKAYSRSGDETRAQKEIELAKKLDPQDPTAWLYSALVRQRQNRINEAVRDLEKSQDLNNNRAVYRSRLLLDQDRAVRSANLASIYQDAGLSEVSIWEASRAVSADYANFSSHLFLANSYQELRDPQNVNLRYETPVVNEYLLASLLAPVGANTLAQSVSQQEYSRLFQTDGFGFASTTEYLSRGAWLESAAQYGTFGRFEYALSGFYHSDPGQRVNNDLQQTELSAQVKYQLTHRDTFYVRTIYGEVKAGDLVHYFDPASANPFVRTKETQEPLLLAGYHREWSPGNHSLLLFGRLQDTFRATDPQQQTLLFGHDSSGALNAVLPITIQQQYRSDFEVYSGEAQHIWERDNNTLLGGIRFQKGELATANQHTNSSFFPFLFPTAPQEVTSDFERLSVYAYDYWRPWPSLQLIAGLSYDRLHYPQNFRYAPISDQEDTKDQWSPKAGLVWTPVSRTTVRAGYSRSLGGVSFDQSFRLEPTQVAGFVQAFRSLVPESVAGANSASTFDTWGVSLEQRIGKGTYVGVGGELLKSDVDRQLGIYNMAGLFVITPGSTPEELRYEEKALLLSFYQLVGSEWSFGARYRLSDATLSRRFSQVDPSVPSSGGFVAAQKDKSLLHELRLFGLFNHPSGVFTEAEAVWYRQDNDGYVPTLPGEDMWQFNAFIGYRFPHRQAELRVGLLNIADHDYRLAPLSGIAELPRERTLAVTFRFYF